jgi:hypothetical protein
MADEPSLIQYGRFIVEGILAISTVTLGILGYKQNTKVKKLEEEKEYLKKQIHKISSKVDPESDRKLLVQASHSVQIMGINSLGPLHHCREEIIEFLTDRKGSLFIILLDPRSEAFIQRQRREEDLSLRLLSEWRASVSILKDISLHTNGRIELRVRTDRPDRSIFIVDALNGLTDRSKMLINYYPEEAGTRGYSGAQFLAEFVMERDRDSMFKNIEYFEYCWEQAAPISLDMAIEIAS